MCDWITIDKVKLKKNQFLNPRPFLAPFKAANLSLSSSQPISYLVYRPLGGNNNSNCNGIQQNSTVAQQPFAARQSYGRDSRSAAPESLQEQQQLKHHQQVVQSNQQHQVQLQPQQVKLQRQGRVATPTIETVDSRSSSLPPPEYRSSTPVGTSKNGEDDDFTVVKLYTY